MDKLDKLYVISDLHLGGRKGFQIFDQGDLLSATIDRMASEDSSKKVGLCINGDAVDFLAEDPPMYFDSDGAIRKLDRIMKDPAFRKIFSSLSKFVRLPDRRLIITLGNHDLELDLPHVRRHLIQKLCGQAEDAAANIELAFGKEGYRCRVGRSEVHCLHGNDADNWNLTDFEALEQFGRDVDTAEGPDEWTPNAGTQLVVDLMNDVKKDFPFVDLLKPESLQLFELLVALKPDLLKNIPTAGAVAARLSIDSTRRFFGWLGDDESAGDTPETSATDIQQARDLQRWRRTKERRAIALIEEAYSDVKDNVRPRDLLAADVATGKLGALSAIAAMFRGKDKAEILREALEKMGQYQGFDIKHVDDVFTLTDRDVPTRADFVVTGHTHHEKALHRRVGRGFYYNSGTWVKLMRLEPDVLNSEYHFRRFFQDIQKGRNSIPALDRRGMIIRRPTVVRISAEGNQTSGELIRPESAGSSMTWRTIDRTRFTRTKS